MSKMRKENPQLQSKPFHLQGYSPLCQHCSRHNSWRRGKSVAGAAGNGKEASRTGKDKLCESSGHPTLPKMKELKSTYLV